MYSKSVICSVKQNSGIFFRSLDCVVDKVGDDTEHQVFVEGLFQILWIAGNFQMEIFFLKTV